MLTFYAVRERRLIIRMIGKHHQGIAGLHEGLCQGRQETHGVRAADIGCDADDPALALMFLENLFIGLILIFFDDGQDVLPGDVAYAAVFVMDDLGYSSW